MPASVPFELPTHTETQFDTTTGLSSVASRLHGVVRLEGEALVVECGGILERTAVSSDRLRQEEEALPVRIIRIPLGTVAGVDLRGWWRPHLELSVRELGALTGLPGGERGRVRLRLARRDRQAARELMIDIRDRQADLALGAAESERPSLPPTGRQ